MYARVSLAFKMKVRVTSTVGSMEFLALTVTVTFFVHSLVVSQPNVCRRAFAAVTEKVGSTLAPEPELGDTVIQSESTNS